MTSADGARVLDDRADPRYQRLMDATRAAARNGYDAVSMRNLAETCKLSMTTIYQFCRTKDHLIAAAHLDNMQGLRDRLVARPPRGATAEARVASVLRSFVKALERDEELSRTLLRALYSLDADVDDTRASVASTAGALIDSAIGDAVVADRRAVITTLGHVVDSVVLAWLGRRHDTIWMRRRLEDAAHVLLRGATENALPPVSS